MLTAGIPLLSTLEDSIGATENKSLKSALSDAKKEIELGLNFSDALSRQKGIFPDILIRLVKVGESTGRQQYLYDVAYIRNSDVTMGEFWHGTTIMSQFDPFCNVIRSVASAAANSRCPQTGSTPGRPWA